MASVEPFVPSECVVGTLSDQSIHSPNVVQFHFPTQPRADVSGFKRARDPEESVASSKIMLLESQCKMIEFQLIAMRRQIELLKSQDAAEEPKAVPVRQGRKAFFSKDMTESQLAQLYQTLNDDTLRARYKSLSQSARNKSDISSIKREHYSSDKSYMQVIRRLETTARKNDIELAICLGEFDRRGFKRPVSKSAKPNKSKKLLRGEKMHTIRESLKPFQETLEIMQDSELEAELERVMAQLAEAEDKDDIIVLEERRKLIVEEQELRQDESTIDSEE